jgi:multidrug efflux pump
VINPVFAVDFMKPHVEDHDLTTEERRKAKKALWIKIVLFIAVAGIFYGVQLFGMGNLTIFTLFLVLLNQFVLSKLVKKFQDTGWPAIQDLYKSFVTWVLEGAKPVIFLVGTLFLLIFSFFAIGLRNPKVDFFPKAAPNFVNTFINLPIGTDQAYTDSLTSLVEKRITAVIHPNLAKGQKNPIVESIISNVTIGASSDQNDRSPSPNKGKISVAFVEFGRRNGEDTEPYLEKVRKATQGIPGIEVSVAQEAAGPPVGAPVAVEIQGDDLEELVATGKSFKKYIDSMNISGIEDLRSDVQTNSPQLSININRERANREGLFTAQIGSEMRTAVFGKEVSKYKDEKDDYPIQLRYQKDQRDNIAALLNHKMTFRDMNKGGMLRQVPVSAVADVRYDNTFGGIKRKNGKRIITLSSGVITGFNANEIVGQITESLDAFQKPENITIKMGGEQEQQKETGAFLGGALLTALGLIFMILVLQFNSFGKPIIILSEILFSITGVFLGLAITGMNVSIIMTGIGVVALAGIVVRNGILMVEFTDMLIEQGMDIKPAIIEAGRTRMTPVILTATATILGLVPLAVGLNMDFVTLFTELNPHIYFGGDSVAFWGPLSWTMIFGLSFATFLTLVLVPVMYLLYARMKGIKQKIKDKIHHNDNTNGTTNGTTNGHSKNGEDTKIHTLANDLMVD